MALTTDSLGSTLKELRKLRGLSQKELAERVGVKQHSLSEIESGVVVPRTSTLIALLDELDATLEVELRDGDVHYSTT